MVIAGTTLAWVTASQSSRPDTNGGTGNKLAPCCFATEGAQLLVGGDVTPLNNEAQEGLAPF